MELEVVMCNGISLLLKSFVEVNDESPKQGREKGQHQANPWVVNCWT